MLKENYICFLSLKKNKTETTKNPEKQQQKPTTKQKTTTVLSPCPFSLAVLYLQNNLAAN